MSANPLCVVQVNTQDMGGGAEAVARNLFRELRERGHDSFLAVGKRRSVDDGVLLIPNGDDLKVRERYRRWWAGDYPPPSSPGEPPPGRSLRWLGYPLIDGWRRLKRARARLLGLDDAEFPGSRRLMELPPRRPDVVHLHNLHGGYFDLRELPRISKVTNTFLTLHDAWTFSGHCAHSLGCERWRLGCGKCPDLSIYPAVKRDATAANWRQKQEIFRNSRLFVSAPSRWLLELAEESILAPAIADARVIPNGVDHSTFFPASKTDARRELGLPADADVLLFAAHGIKSNCFKDYAALKAAVERLAGRERPVLCLALGEAGPAERIGAAEIRFLPPLHDPRDVAEHYRAADIYLHAAKADTFPTTVIEALSCGTPVVATAVGGIPEQVQSLRLSEPGCAPAGVPAYSADRATGVLVPAGDAASLAAACAKLLDNPSLRESLGQNASADARRRFSLARHIDAWLDWYLEAAAPAARAAA